MKKILFIIIFMLSAFNIFAAEESSGVDAKINELRQKISELQKQENSLSKQIGILNGNINLTLLNIQVKEGAILKLTQEANQLAGEIDKLEELLNKRSEMILRRIPEAYKRNSTPRFGMIFFTNDFSQFLTRLEYISTVQSADAQLLVQLKATQNNFSERKALREKKKIEQEELRSQLEAEKYTLEKNKKEKQYLLDQTKNNESVYQKLLAQALAEKQAIEKALIEGVKVGPVKKGDPIAFVGNTGYPGCSTGAHLHFEIRKNNSWVDPAGYLSNKTVNDEQNGGTWNVGSGSWDWPLADTIRLTQRYGHTPYSWRYSYSGGVHTGFDMVSTSSEVIRAPADGQLYSSSQACGKSSIIKIKYIEHNEGLVSFYLHVQ